MGQRARPGWKYMSSCVGSGWEGASINTSTPGQTLSKIAGLKT